MMKRKLYISIGMIIMSTLAAAGCAANNSSSSDNGTNSDSGSNSAIETYEVSKASDSEAVGIEGDRVIYNGLDSLMAASDLVVIGKFTQDTTQNIEYTYSEEYNKDIVTDALSTNVISIEKVLSGETDATEFTVSQRYGVIEGTNQMVTFSEMTPMNKGDEWIFFLYYDDINDTYWCAGDYTGRYPVPAEGKTFYEKDDITTVEFGVYYDVSLVNVDLYNEIISTFDCTLE